MKYTKEFLSPIVKESFTMIEVVRKIGLRTDNGFSTYIAKLVRKFEINFSHFKTQSQQARDRHPDTCPIEDYLSNKRPIGSDRLRQKLLFSGLKEKKCEECGILDWNGNYLSFNLHHKDNNHYNNNIENLMIVCPNCHYCLHDCDRKNKKAEKERKKKKKHLVGDNKRASNLRLDQRKVIRPPYSQLKKEIEETNYCKVARKYGVSDNAIRRWIKMYEKYDILD